MVEGSLFLASVHVFEGVTYVHIVPMAVAVFPSAYPLTSLEHIS